MEGFQYRFIKDLSVQRLEIFKKRLIKNPDKTKQNSDTIRMHVEFGHATKLRTTESTTTKFMTYYILHYYATDPNIQNKFKDNLMLQQNFQG